MLNFNEEKLAPPRRSREAKIKNRRLHMKRIKNSLIAFGGRSLPCLSLLVGLLAMCWLGADRAPSQAHLAPLQGQAADQSFFAPESWAREITSAQGWETTKHPRMLADVNGDGRQDVVGFGGDGVWIATSEGYRFRPAFVLAEFGYGKSWRVTKHVRTMGDINGDRLEDIVAFGDGGVWRALSTASGFAQATFMIGEFGYNQGWRVDKHVRLLADVNGDGRKDIVAFGDAGVWLALATADGYFSAPAFVLANFGNNQGWNSALHIRTTADVNGDGRQDIVGIGDAGVWTALSTGSGFGPAQFVLAEFGQHTGWGYDRPRLLADIDGDGDQDIVAFGDAGVWTARAVGGGFAAAQFVLAEFGYNSGWENARNYPRFVADLNGDGYQDIVGYKNDSVYRALGGPGGFGSPRGVLRDLVSNTGFGLANPRFVGDVTGNGKHDLVAFGSSDIYVARSSDLPPPPPPDAPTYLSVSLYNQGQGPIGLLWMDSSSDERSFIIHKKHPDGTMSQISVEANKARYVDPNYLPDALYCYTVQAENLWGLSAETPQRCVRTPPDQDPPDPPPPPPTPQQPYIIAGIESAPAPCGSVLHIRSFGNLGEDHFQPLEDVSLKIVFRVDGGNPQTVIEVTTANSNGRIDYIYGCRVCPFGPESVRFEVQATGLSSGKISNVATAGCF
jgi:hypothetical protein